MTLHLVAKSRGRTALVAPPVEHWNRLSTTEQNDNEHTSLKFTALRHRVNRNVSKQVSILSSLTRGEV